MKRIWVTEHERLYRGKAGDSSARNESGRVVLAPRHFERLRRFDEALSRTEGRQVFDWKSRYAKASQWVGVMQVRGLSVEVLPKIEDPGAEGFRARDEFARKNLLYMLSISGDLPLRERDVSSQAVCSAPLIEVLIRIFADRLFEEFNRGVEHGYVQQRENLHLLRGKLRFSEHLRQNAARRERLFVEYEEFLPDTPMNRIFRAACRRLLEVSRRPATQERLTYCLMMLEGVEDLEVAESDFERVVLNRQNERFREVFHFCSLILTGHSPASTMGERATFSLFFDMNRVFESFVTQLIRRYVLQEELAGCRCFPQSKTRSRYLMFRGTRPKSTTTVKTKGVYALKPDILVVRDDRHFILDTKWKRLTREKGRQGVSRNDLLQLYAYATRFDAPVSVLLYPKVSGVRPTEFQLPAAPDGSISRVQVRLVDLDRDLRADKAKLVKELRALISPAFLPAEKAAETTEELRQ